MEIVLYASGRDKINNLFSFTQSHFTLQKFDFIFVTLIFQQLL